jgi:hypothetical protein
MAREIVRPIRFSEEEARAVDIVAKALRRSRCDAIRIVMLEKARELAAEVAGEGQRG